MNNKEYKYHRVSEGDYRKAVFQLRSQFSAILNCFRCYGNNELVEGAIVECVEASEQFGMRIRGKDQMIKVRNEPSPRPTD